MHDHHRNPQTACVATRRAALALQRRQHLSLNVEATMPAATVAGSAVRGHQMEAIGDTYQHFDAGQFIWLTLLLAPRHPRECEDPRSKRRSFSGVMRDA